MLENIENSNYTGKYKFRELKVYSSTEWLADNNKKYRQVFDRYETSYIYAEFSFYNKYFDIDDWEIDVELKCYNVKKGKKEICSLPLKRKVSKFDNISYIREGWGNKRAGTFWKKGIYYWEVWVDNEKISTKYFFIEEADYNGIAGENKYMDIKYVKLYEGPYDDILEADRVYYKCFSGDETRYIYCELLLKNLNISKSWQCELFIKFYNNAKELKGQVIRLQKIDKKDDEIKITAGWGSNVKGSWRNDKYTAEIIFMDKQIAVLPFEVDDDFVEGINPLTLSSEPNVKHYQSDMDNYSLEDVMDKLNSLIGLNHIKQKVKDHAKYIQFLQLRKEKGFDEKEEINIHSVFIGNPGTGKTTVASMMGMLYKKMGLLSKGHVHEVDRVDLVGEYIGQTAPKVKEAIEKARGGVLFIDEAYALARSNDDTKDFGREVIEILVKEMSNGKGDMAVIVAGYPKEMKHFLDSNPGLKSRFRINYEFQDYLPQELIQIADKACTEKGISMTPLAHDKIDNFIVEAYRNRDKSFGNARFVHNLIEEAKVNLGLRIMNKKPQKTYTKDELSIVELEDVLNIKLSPNKIIPMIPIDENLLKESLLELDKLIGMTKVKTQIHEMVNLVRYYRITNKNVLHSFYLHTIFIGNPGTGKTTVARILAKLYKALGILEKGHMVETDRQGLVAGFVGQTAIKTAEKIDEALGGVLFIDEAYSLSNHTGGAHGDFGDEAIQILLKRMEDQRGKFFVFVAGYTDNMEGFIKANPGLASRFDKTLKFEDYSPEDLNLIALQMIHEEGYVLEDEAKVHVAKYLEFIYQYRDKYFGNARSVRQVVQEIIKNQNLRLAALPVEQLVNQITNIIEYKDVESLKMDKNSFIFNRKTIGFKNS